MAPPRQRVATTNCAKCRRPFMVGDRLVTVYIVSKVGRNPETKDIGAWLLEDFELAHVTCADPGLDGSIIVEH